MKKLFTLMLASMIGVASIGCGKEKKDDKAAKNGDAGKKADPAKKEDKK